jgi:hypothetical protein
MAADLSPVIRILRARKLNFPPAVNDRYEKARRGFPSGHNSSVSIS